MSGNLSQQGSNQLYTEGKHRLDTCHINLLMGNVNKITSQVEEAIKLYPIEKCKRLLFINPETKIVSGSAYLDFEVQTNKLVAIHYITNDDNTKINIEFQKQIKKVNSIKTNEFYDMFRKYSKLEFFSKEKDKTGLSRVLIGNDTNTIQVDAYFGVLNRKLAFKTNGELILSNSFDSIKERTLVARKNLKLEDKSIDSTQFDKLVSDRNIIEQINNLYKKITLRRQLGFNKIYHFGRIDISDKIGYYLN